MFSGDTQATSREKSLKAYAKVKGQASLHSIARIYAVAHVSGRPAANFSRITRHVALIRGRACAL